MSRPPHRMSIESNVLSIQPDRQSEHIYRGKTRSTDQITKQTACLAGNTDCVRHNLKFIVI